MISKGGYTILEICRGRYELFYFFDYFYEGGFPNSYFTQYCFYSSFYCKFVRFIVILMATNIIDMILLVKIVIEMKSHLKPSTVSRITSILPIKGHTVANQDPPKNQLSALQARLGLLV